MILSLNTDACAAYRQIAAVRSGFYRLLSIAFRYPDRDVAAELGSEDSRGLADAIKEAFSVSPAPIALIDGFIESARSFDVPAHQVEYTRLFIGPFHLAAPPYESVYRPESRGKVMGDSTLDVQARYREEGLALSGSIHDLPDHITAELEFMSYLAEQEALWWEGEPEGVRSRLVKQDVFLSEHLTTWTPLFTQAMLKETRREFYRRLALLLECFVQLDHDYLRALMRSPDLPERGIDRDGE